MICKHASLWPVVWEGDADESGDDDSSEVGSLGFVGRAVRVRCGGFALAAGGDRPLIRRLRSSAAVGSEREQCPARCYDIITARTAGGIP